MPKPEAVGMLPAAFSLLGTPYSEMDCQAFIEACLRAIGIRENLPGSNAWYRRMDWVGTPEECRTQYGSIPPGAFLFILEAEDEGTPEKYRGDGIGDATHIGLYTGQGEGAIHSSASRGCVCESNFKGKTIPRGGWNRVGLWTSRLVYGMELGQPLEEVIPMPDIMATVTASSGATVKMRAKPSRSCAEYWDVPVGARVPVSGHSGAWDRIEYGGRSGWMLGQYLVPDEELVAEDPPQPDGWVTITVPIDVARALYDALGVGMEANAL